MKLSVVTTLYQSSPYLNEFYERVVKAARKVTSDFELILVDDGSTDDSLLLSRKLLKKKNRIKIIVLARNYRHHHAIMAGLAQARGNLVFLVDSDLEEPPEILEKLHQRIQEGAGIASIDVAYAIRQVRKGRWLEKLAGAFFYYFFNLLTSVPVPSNWMVARLMTRRYVRALLKHRERELFLGGIMALTGFRQVGVYGEKNNKGTTAYSLAKKISATLNALTSFSNRPLTLIFMMGSFFSAVSICGGLYLLMSVVFFKMKYLVGWASIVLSITFFGGLILASLGILGFYIGRIFTEVKKRPLIVKDVYANY